MPIKLSITAEIPGERPCEIRLDENGKPKFVSGSASPGPDGTALIAKELIAIGDRLNVLVEQFWMLHPELIDHSSS